MKACSWEVIIRSPCPPRHLEDVGRILYTFIGLVELAGVFDLKGGTTSSYFGRPKLRISLKEVEALPVLIVTSYFDRATNILLIHVMCYVRDS